MNWKLLVQCKAMAPKGLRKPHEYVPVALVGIHADEVFSNPLAPWLPDGKWYSEMFKLTRKSFLEFTTGNGGSGTYANENFP